MHSPQDAACGSRLEPTERDPLLPSSTNSNIRVRRKSPAQNSSHMNYNQDKNLSTVGHPTNARGGSGIVHDRASSFMPLSQPAPRVNPRESGNTIPENTDSSQDFDDRTFDSGEPTVDYSINHTQDEIFAIRRAALSAFIPLTYAWPVISVGFATSAAFGMAQYTKLKQFPLWVTFLPCWISHAGILICIVLSANAMSDFIARANVRRQQSDSKDHLDKQEYIPLLQRTLKFGLKTITLSFFIFLLEILIYLKISGKKDIKLNAALTPMWIIVTCGIIDGIICKNQHICQLACWVLSFVFMILLVMRVDCDTCERYGENSAVILGPLIALLSIFLSSLLYILHGYMMGYFCLTDLQLTAGILHCLSTSIFSVLLALIVYADLDSDFFYGLLAVALSMLVILLVGLGGWAISQDEFDRMLQFGAEDAIRPKKLCLEPSGWTVNDNEGVSSIPMLGEVRFKPLTGDKNMCSACYPYVKDNDTASQDEECNERRNELQYTTSQLSRIENSSNPNISLRRIV